MSTKLEEVHTEKVSHGAIRPGTQRFYSDIIKRQIIPWLGTIQVSKLQPIQAQQFLQQLANHGASQHQRHNTYGVLSQAFDFAVKLNLAAYNPLGRVDKPKVKQGEHVAFDEVQVRRFLEEAKSDRLYALYYLAIATGMRQGELFGLQWDDVDLDAGTIRIQRTASERGDGEMTFGEPKTPKSRRTLPISPMTVKVLHDHRAGQQAEGINSSWIFCNSVGGVLRRSNVLHRSFKPILKRAGLPNIRFHDLRHTCASHLLAKGANVKVVSEILGHSQIGITLNTYAHVFPETKREAAILIDGLFGDPDSAP